MNRDIKFYFLCVFMVMTGFFSVAASHADTPASKSSAKVVAMTGQAEFQRVGQAVWEPVTLDLSLQEGDKIKTDAASTVDLEFFGKRKTGRITVDESTDFTLATFRYDENSAKEVTLLDVATGSILVQAEKLQGDSTFEVKTPASMVGIRGTTFRVKASED